MALNTLVGFLNKVDTLTCAAGFSQGATSDQLVRMVAAQLPTVGPFDLLGRRIQLNLQKTGRFL